MMALSPLRTLVRLFSFARNQGRSPLGRARPPPGRARLQRWPAEIWGKKLNHKAPRTLVGAPSRGRARPYVGYVAPTRRINRASSAPGDGSDQPSSPATAPALCSGVLFCPCFHVPSTVSITNRNGRIIRIIRTIASSDILALVYGFFGSRRASNMAERSSAMGRRVSGGSGSSRPRRCTAT